MGISLTIDSIKLKFIGSAVRKEKQSKCKTTFNMCDFSLNCRPNISDKHGNSVVPMIAHIRINFILGLCLLSWPNKLLYNFKLLTYLVFLYEDHQIKGGPCGWSIGKFHSLPISSLAYSQGRIGISPPPSHPSTYQRAPGIPIKQIWSWIFLFSILISLTLFQSHILIPKLIDIYILIACQPISVVRGKNVASHNIDENELFLQNAARILCHALDSTSIIFYIYIYFDF